MLFGIIFNERYSIKYNDNLFVSLAKGDPSRGCILLKKGISS